MRSIRLRSVPVALAMSGLISAMTGCSAGPGVRSHSGDSNHLGVSYYLPMRYAKVTYTRKRADADADKALKEAIGGSKEAAAKHKAATEAVTTLTNLVAALKAGGMTDSDAPVLAARADLIRAQQEVVSTTAAIAKADEKERDARIASRQLANSVDMCGWVDSIKIQVLDPVPDVTQRHILHPVQSASRSDTFKIKTTTSGLLQTIDAELKDESSEILVNLARSISAVGNSSMPYSTQGYVPVTRAPTTRCSDLDWSGKELELTVNPSVQASWDLAAAAINAMAEVPGVAGAAERRFEYRLVLDPKVKASTTLRPSDQGVFYRRERPYVLSISQQSLPVGDVLMMLPNDAPVDAIDLEATSFVTNKSTLGFTNGMLVDVDTHRPSSALAIVSVPWKISTAVLQQVKDLLTVRVDIAKSNNSIANEDLALLKATKEILEAQQALDDAQAASSTP